MASLDDILRGEPYGQLTGEGQNLWDQYQSILQQQQNAPMRTLKLRSGATTQIPDPGFMMKNKMLSNTLGGMTGTGLGTRAKAQPGYLSQFSPLMMALGQKYGPDFLKWLQNSGLNPTSLGETGIGSSPTVNDDWWGNAPDTSATTDIPTDFDLSNFDFGDYYS